METKQDSRILLCHCAYASILPLQVRQEVLQALKESGLSFDAVVDLCELAARKAPLLAELAGASRLTIAACHPRAVKWLFAAGGASLRDKDVEYLDMREASTEQLLRSIRALASGGETTRCAGKNVSEPLPHQYPAAIDPEAENHSAPSWQPWFPVIDYARCQNCQQCLGFCLFGVYGAGPDGKVLVKNPASCKTDCPACARVCPETAIIFPKYPHPPINGGEVPEGAGWTEPVKVDMTAFANGDVLKALRERSKQGPRFTADPGRVRAVQERLVRLAGSPNPFNIAPGAPAAQPPVKKEPE